MYHIGKVMKVYRKLEREFGVQATVEMWDENILILDVEPKISNEINEKDYVLVDYRPMPSMNVPVAKQVVYRVLSDDEALTTWDLYKKQYERNKNMVKPSAIGMAGPYR